jgi:long-subunit fatty acid transport protein
MLRDFCDLRAIVFICSGLVFAASQAQANGYGIGAESVTGLGRADAGTRTPRAWRC